MNSALFLGFITSFPWFSYVFSASTPSSLLPMMEEKSWVSSPGDAGFITMGKHRKNGAKMWGKTWETYSYGKHPETYIGTYRRTWENHEKPWETTTIDGGFKWEHHL